MTEEIEKPLWRKKLEKGVIYTGAVAVIWLAKIIMDAGIGFVERYESVKTWHKNVTMELIAPVEARIMSYHAQDIAGIDKARVERDTAFFRELTIQRELQVKILGEIGEIKARLPKK